MTTFNLSNRIILFAICSSIEFDIRKFILSGEDIILSEFLQEKAKDRSKNTADTLEKRLNEFDLGDYIEVIKMNPYKLGLNNEKVNNLEKYFNKLIPIRNRVMHTRPLEIGDRAILFEFLDDLSDKIGWINWSETKITKNLIHENPTKLFEMKKYYNNNIKDSVYHNLPNPEFDDTGYIGRKKEIKKLKELLQNNKHQIVSIIGNGGLGKTALTIKVLYELIDDIDNEYEAVLWVTLKTRTLSQGEFNYLENTVKDIPELMEEMQKQMIFSNEKSSEENILEFLDSFKTLLVLDNLETINTNEVMDFLKKIPEKSKVLITSRHGLGELEYRYILEGLSLSDSTAYFRELSKYYGLKLHELDHSEIKEIVMDSLYSNPLSIKWFITSIFKGLDINSLLLNKGDLIEFCMSNVYDKLSNNSKQILQLFLIEKYDLSYGEIDFYLDLDPVELRESINEMLSTNMVTLRSGTYILNEMAKDYLSKFYPPTNQFFYFINKKRKDLNALLQMVTTMKENDSFNPRALAHSMESKDYRIASYYLYQAFENKNLTKAREYLDKAINVAPNYFEVYKVQAFIEGNHNNIYKAEQSYDIALNRCMEAENKARVALLYSTFYVLKVEDYPRALEIIEEADRNLPNNLEILFEKNRILMRLGKFKECFEILEEIKELSQDYSEKHKRLMVKSYAELYRRKAETLSAKTDIHLKIELLENALNEIEKLKPLDLDRKNALTLLAILADLSFLALNNSAINLLEKNIMKYYDQLKWINSTDFKKIRSNIEKYKNEILPEKYNNIKKYIIDTKALSRNITETNKGVITKIVDEGYGFIANSNRKDIFFHVNNTVGKLNTGDVVTFETYFNRKGIAAKNVTKFEGH
ncbi:NB-ARC domain-containing protein [Macrococcus sp. DPC7161]|uniref:NB-ARC domain-containing protein n=1 Tax=Macrococcus sp. DPC7161 TaxID=2507060 RepID=UPI00100BC86F|nr:NB-ARC domain-containing protein [Macrococcus sp. DPC7161]RXK18524.1 AAA family ATPase [Macrococcus sp. DPC7161]